MNNVENKLLIAAPTVVNMQGRSRVIANIQSAEWTRDLWYEVPENYGQYLCHERSDAFLVGVLSYAMRNHLDVECEAPVGEELLYQLRTYFIPALVRNAKDLYETKIIANVDTCPIENAKGVGTGISCGVDSLHAVALHAACEYPNQRLTHLVLNNVGSFWAHKEQRQWQIEHAKGFCDKFGFKLIVTDSNYADVIQLNHGLTHIFSSAFCILALQKLWHVYYYGSTYDFSRFSLNENDEHDPAYYELLSVHALSTSSLRVYSEGGAITRFLKTKDLIGYAPSCDYLHVCWMDSGPNCMTCGKCRRTLVTLDALGALDKYAKSFDIDYYRKHRRDYLKWLYRQVTFPGGDKMVGEAYDILRQDIDWRIKIGSWIRWLAGRLRAGLRMMVKMVTN